MLFDRVTKYTIRGGIQNHFARTGSVCLRGIASRSLSLSLSFSVRRENEGTKRKHRAVTLISVIFGTTLRVQLFLKEPRDFYEDHYARVLGIDFVPASSVPLNAEFQWTLLFSFLPFSLFAVEGVRLKIVGRSMMNFVLVNYSVSSAR